MGVGESSCDLDLPQEPLRAQQGRELGLQNLDRDLAVVLEVLGEVDSSHASAAELALKPVAVGQRGLETIERSGIGHARGPRAPRLAYVTAGRTERLEPAPPVGLSEDRRVHFPVEGPASQYQPH